jgi:hypothetical protein
MILLRLLLLLLLPGLLLRLRLLLLLSRPVFVHLQKCMMECMYLCRCACMQCAHAYERSIWAGESLRCAWD